MHILVVHQYYLHKDDAGGSRWNQFAKYWTQAGHKVTVLSGMVHYATGKKHPEYKGKFLVNEYEGENITIKRCHVSESYNKSFIGRAWAYVSFTFSSTIAGLGISKPDVLICTSPPLTVGVTGAILGFFKRVPMVFEVRDLWPESAIDTGVLKSRGLIKISYWMEKISYKSARWINVLTPAFEETLATRKGISRNRISMIPNGADLDIITPGERDNWVRQKHNLEGKFVVTYVGAHGVANSLGQLMKAAKILKSSDPDVQIMLVGDGMEKADLKKMAADDELSNVTFVDSVPKSVINDYINASDICTAVLKRVDTFKTVYPNKLFDYMAAARPIIVGIDGVARKLVEDAGAGRFSQPENPEEFARVVCEMKADPEKLADCGQRGREFVKEHFSRQVLADKYMSILQSLVSEKKS